MTIRNYRSGFTKAMVMFGQATAFSVPFVGPASDAGTASLTVAARWEMPDIPYFLQTSSVLPGVWRISMTSVNEHEDLSGP
jgi:hypothetical protein